MGKVFSVKESFLSIQGEGFHSGRRTVFIRFSGCNLWNGKEESRESSPCPFCDTDFVGTDGDGGGRFEHPEQLAYRAKSLWYESVPPEKSIPYVVLTGGEPTLQVTAELVRCLKNEGFEVGIETNGTKRVPEGIDWIAVSPKGDSTLVQTSGNEIKVVFPQSKNSPIDFESLKFEHKFIQAKDEGDMNKNRENSLRVDAFIKNHSGWRKSVQIHKIMQIR